MVSLRLRIFLGITGLLALTALSIGLPIVKSAIEIQKNSAIAIMQQELTLIQQYGLDLARDETNVLGEHLRNWLIADHGLAEVVGKAVLIRGGDTSALWYFDAKSGQPKLSENFEIITHPAFKSSRSSQTGHGVRMLQVSAAELQDLHDSKGSIRVVMNTRENSLGNVEYYMYFWDPAQLSLWHWQNIVERSRLALFAGSVLLLILAFTIAHLIASPLRKLANMACQIGQGDLDSALPFARRSDEIGLLGVAMRVMAESLKKSYQQLALHSQSLEKTVADQTDLLRKEQAYLKSVLHSIKDGLLVIDESLTILPGVSQTSHQILEQEQLIGRPLLDVLFFFDEEHKSERQKFQDILLTAFNLFVPEQFGAVVANLPKHWAINFRNQTKLLEIDMTPIIENGEIRKIILDMHDATEKQAVKHVGKYAHHKAISFIEQLQDLAESRHQRLALSDFLNESHELILEIKVQLIDQDTIDANHMFRRLHTVKGNASALGLESVAFIAHEAEGLIQKFRDHRQEFSELDMADLKSHIRYLLRGISSAQFVLRANLDEEESFPQRWEAYTEATTDGLLRSAAEMGKELDIEWSVSDELEAEDFTLLKRVVVHLLRNAIDHGIEKVQDRLTKQKSARGLIQVDVQWKQACWYLRLSDDGGGIDINNLRLAAMKRGIAVPDGELGPAEQLEILCHPGFSSKDEVTTVSGRGVGMDAVAEEIRLLGGDIELVQSSSRGTVFQLYWPTQASSDKSEASKSEPLRALTA